MKGMVAVMIEVMQELNNQSNPPDVALLLNGDEEVGGMDGDGYMAREVGMKPEFVICPDGRCEESLELFTKGKGV
jgi:acetylornithine deacetylase/succinyl-diaminopimelate desuccinylase-like protein